ncbi:MAG: metallophosphoesterase [Chakrabartia sp.]
MPSRFSLSRSIDQLLGRLGRRRAGGRTPDNAEAWRPAALPEGQRVYAIGDVHGRLDLLEQLLDQIRADDAARSRAATLIIFMGDLIDRGPHSAAVVSRVKALAAERPVRVLAGNHEEMFLRALQDNEVMRQFLLHGGRETFLSYGLAADALRDMSFEELRAAIGEVVPSDHIAFFEELEAMIQLGDYVFVHAGIRPDVALAEQRGGDLRWIREPFLSSEHDFGVVVVHGHSIAVDPDIRANRIGIDTGAYVSGRLTALGLEGTARWFLTVQDAAGCRSE